MASKFLRRQQWWVKFRHPRTGEIIRESLETADQARAELLRQRLDLEVALLEPRFQAAEIPQRLLSALGKNGATEFASIEPLVAVPQIAIAPAVVTPARRTTVDEAVPGYVTKNHRITYLTHEQVTEQLAALECEPAVQIAATIMIYAGLRRAEALWLTKDAIAPDLSFLSIRKPRGWRAPSPQP